MWCDRLIPDIWCCDSHRHISFLTLTYIHLILGLLYLTLYIDTVTCHAYIWYPTLVLAMLYLTHDTRHRYLPCYIWHMIPDTGHLACYTWCMIYGTGPWYMSYLTPAPDTRYMICFHVVQMHGPDIVTLDRTLPPLIPVLYDIFMTITFTGTWHDYYIITRHLVLLNSCILEPLK